MSWVGDRALASLELMDPNQDKCGVHHHILVDAGYKRMGLGASLTHTRVSNEVAAQWVNRSRVLYDMVRDTRGQLTKVPNHPFDSAPPPEESV